MIFPPDTCIIYMLKNVDGTWTHRAESKQHAPRTGELLIFAENADRCFQVEDVVHIHEKNEILLVFAREVAQKSELSKFLVEGFKELGKVPHDED